MIEPHRTTRTPRCLLMKLWWSFVSLLFIVLSSLGEATDFSSRVVAILDGDTIEVLHNGNAQRVRMYGIDCPKKGQAFGNHAKQAASALVFAQEVTLEIHVKDRYGNSLADILLADGTNVGHSLVKDGWCWWYRKYAPDDTVLEALENEARQTGKGLWVDPDPMPPWKWRKIRMD